MATTDVSQYNGLLAQKKRLRRRAEFKKLLPLYLMMLPGLIYLICNNYLPMFGILIAFKQVNFSIGILQSDWVGFQNFEFLFKTKDAWTMIRNTICYNVVFIALGLVISIAIAILMAEISSRKIAKVRAWPPPVPRTPRKSSRRSPRRRRPFGCTGRTTRCSEW